MNPQTRQFISDSRTLPAKEIASTLSKDVTTSQKIDCKALAAHLLTVGLTTRLRVAMASGKLPEALQNGIQKLFDSLSFGIDYVDTTKPEIATEVVSLLQGIQSVGLVSQDEVNELMSLSGGFQYDRLTSDEVQSEIDRLDLSENFRAIRAKAADGYNAVVSYIDEREASGSSVLEDEAIKLFSERVK
jgi:hypothetical protein